MRSITTIAQRALQSWLDHRSPTAGAAIAFYATFSLAPMLFIVLAVAGLVFDPREVQATIHSELSGFLGEDGAKAMGALMQANALQGNNGVRALLGAAALLLAATTVFAELKAAVERIWTEPAIDGVAAVPRPLRNERLPAWLDGAWQWLRTRLLSFGLVLSLAFLLIVSLMWSAAISALQGWWAPALADFAWLLRLVDWTVSITLTSVLVAAIYKWLPGVQLQWGQVLMGGFITALLLALGRTLIGLYLAASGSTASFGPAGYLAVTLLWVYYSAQIFLFGAEVARAVVMGRLEERAPQGPLNTTA
jgi:membrane protein